MDNQDQPKLDDQSRSLDVEPATQKQPSTINVPPKASILQRYFLLWVFLLLLWLVVGRSLLGSFGWGTFFMFLLSPVIIVFGAVIQVIVNHRYNKTGYVFGGLMKTATWMLIISTFVLGLTVTDCGDGGCVGSVLMTLFGLPSTYADSLSNAPAIVVIGSLIYALSIMVIPVATLMTFFGAIFENRFSSQTPSETKS